jgi:hypothetical protein
MVVAAASLLVAAVGRMGPFLPADPYRAPVALLIWSLPVLVAMVQEFRTTRRVHPVYWIGLTVFVVRRYNVPPLAQTDGWRNIAHAVFTLLS